MSVREELITGSELAGYRVEALIGRGGMADVYRAEDLRLGRKVALKLLTPALTEDAPFRERFLRESRIAASLDHPNIVPVYDAGEREGHLYIAMRYVEGTDLKGLLAAEGPLELDEALAVLSYVADALDAAHARGLVHRDVKPGNVLLARDPDGGPHGHVYLTDFGLTKQAAAGTRLTGTGQFVGTPEYVSPEQIAGGPVDARTDVYSLGCVLFECLTGEPPFHSDSFMAVLWSHVNDSPPSAAARMPVVPGEIDAVIGRALAKRPGDRYDSCGTLLAAAKASVMAAIRPAAVRKLVTVLGSTIAPAGDEELDPEQLHRLLALYIELASPILERHGTAVAPTPTGFRAVFGFPAVHEDDAVRAVRAALELRDAVSRLELTDTRGAAVAARTGVATGVVVTTDGPLVGDVLGREERLERQAEPGEVLVAEATLPLLQGAFDLEPAAGGSTSAWRVVGEARVEQRVDSRAEMPFVGRQAELALLLRTLERTIEERASSLVTVVGHPGIGKSRLTSEFVAQAKARATVLSGRCLAYGEGITFAPLREVVQQAAGSASQEAIYALVQGQPDAERVADAVSSALGLADTPHTEVERAWAFRRLFDALARRRPVVVVLEDLHWAEPTLLDLVDQLAEAVSAPLVLVCTARPELLELRRPSGVRSSATLIRLEALPEDQVETLLEHHAGGHELSKALLRRVGEASEGIPLFLEQLVAMLAEGRAVPDGPLLPPTIEALLAARLDRLGPTERAVLDHAAVIGKDFSAETLLGLLPSDVHPVLETTLDSLVRRQFLRYRADSVAADHYRFVHGLMQEAAYRAIAKELRADLHERAASHLARTAGTSVADVEEALGYHLEQAYRFRLELGAPSDRTRALAAEAYGHLSSAGDRALGRGDVTTAAALLERAVPLADDRTRGASLALLAEAHAGAGRRERASELRKLAFEEAQALQDRRLALLLAVAEAGDQFSQGGSSGATVITKLSNVLIPELGELDDHVGLSRAWGLIGEIQMAAGRHAESLAAHEQALEYAQRSGRAMLVDRAAVGIVNVLGDGPTPVALALARVRDLRTLVGSFGTLLMGGATGLLLAMDNRIDEARAVHAETRAAYQDLGIHRELVEVLILAGEAELVAGDPALAERSLTAAWDLVAGEPHPWLSERRARALRELGRTSEASAALELAERTVSVDVGELVARTKVTRALLHVDTGALEQAVADALEAERVSEAFDSPPFESPRYRGEILLAAAEVLDAAGRRADAAKRAEAALARFAQKGNVASAERARALLANLAN